MFRVTQGVLWGVMVLGFGLGCGEETADTGDSGDIAPTYCEQLELPSREMDMVGPFGIGRYSLAEDFTLKTSAGDWTLSEEWTGCDTYMFVPDGDASSQSWGVSLWDTRQDLKHMLQNSPRNVHWFFFTTATGAPGKLGDLEEDILSILDNMNAEDRDWWLSHTHFVTKSMMNWNNWLANHHLMTQYGFGIDRFQEIRDVGSLADYERYDEGMGWYAPNVKYAANEPVYYNFEAEREEILAAQEDVTIVSLYEDFGFSGSNYVEVSLPSEEEMAAFDSLEFDLSMRCGASDREFGTCPPWDYLVYLYQCATQVSPSDDANPYVDEACQSYVAPIIEVIEAMGACVEVLKEGDTGTLISDSDTDVTEDTGSVDVSQPCISADDCTGEDGTEWVCEGYVAPVVGESEIPADSYSCECDYPTGDVVEHAFVCNGEGTGFNDCNCPCDTEIGRWITTYHREGRWIHDVTPMLAYMKDGGEKTFRFYTQQHYELSLDLRFRDLGRSDQPSEMVYLYGGGSFNGDYNNNYETILVDIPDDATRVDLVAVISGHGYGQDQANCAEFCNHTHHFTVNGNEFVKDHPWADVTDGCVQQVAEGTVPNQFGTWFYGRGGWCPGKEVVPWVMDVTDQVVPGEQAALTYEGRLGGLPYVPQSANNGGFGANIRMQSYLLIWR